MPTRGVRVAIALGLLAAITGCPPSATREPPFLPMDEAIGIINENNAKLIPDGSDLKGSPVEANGQFREPGEDRPTNFSLRGTLRYRPPRDFILLLRDGLTGSEVMQAGSNATEFWLLVRPEVNTLWWGTYAGLSRGTDLAAEGLERMPFRPDQLIEVLGYSRLSPDTTGPQGPMYRPEEGGSDAGGSKAAGLRNVLIFIDYDDTGQGYIQKEYRLDRTAPFLIREIVFRQPDGRVQMHAALDDYAKVADTGALAARHVRIEWPTVKSWLELRIRRVIVEQSEFEPMNPRDVGGFDREVRVDRPPMRHWVEPSTETQPSPSTQPATAPSTEPSAAPSTEPTTEPSSQPVALPGGGV